MSSLLCNCILIAVIVENHVSQRQDVENGSRLFSSFVKILEYSVLTLIQNIWRFEVVSNIFKGHHHLRSQADDPPLAWTKLIHLGYSQKGCGFSPSQFRGRSWLGSKAQTLLKDEIGDDAPAVTQKLWLVIYL